MKIYNIGTQGCHVAMYNKLSKTVPVAVTGTTLTNALVSLKYWKVVNQSLTREVVFPDFETTWGFLTQVSMRSHLWGHHPTITTTYNRVQLKLQTHDLDNEISDIDIKMAKRIEKYIQMYGRVEI